jgi:hypothetical protein
VGETYTGVSKNATFVDKEFGEWETWVTNVIAGHGHKLRGKKKSQETNLKKYGSISPLGGKEIRKKIEATNIEKYGAPCVFGSECVRERIKETLLERYGYDNALKSPEIKQRSYETNIERYGVPHPFQREEIYEKFKQACLEKYGVDNPWKSPDIRQKIKETCVERYGVENPAQNIDIHNRTLLSNKRVTVIEHWKTSEILSCTASYEVAVVRWLNENKVDFDWQVKFDIPYDHELGCISGKIYIVDLLIKDKNPFVNPNTYVEIKGYFMRDISRLKWEWFNRTYENSVLWTGPVLEEYGILRKK